MSIKELKERYPNECHCKKDESIKSYPIISCPIHGIQVYKDIQTLLFSLEKEKERAEEGFMKKKFWVEIEGKDWDVGYPFCASCEELVVGGHCAWQGNRCKYPEERKKRPITLWRAFCKLTRQTGKTLESVCDELGNCLDT